MTSASESIFTYPDGKSWDDYNDLDFVPPFLDELLANATEAKRNEVLAQCGDDRECQFDSLAVGTEFGAQSAATGSARAEQQATLGRFRLFFCCNHEFKT